MIFLRIRFWSLALPAGPANLSELHQQLLTPFQEVEARRISVAMFWELVINLFWVRMMSRPPCRFSRVVRLGVPGCHGQLRAAFTACGENDLSGNVNGQIQDYNMIRIKLERVGRPHPQLWHRHHWPHGLLRAPHGPPPRRFGSDALGQTLTRQINI